MKDKLFDKGSLSCTSAFDILSLPALATRLCCDVHLRPVINSAYLCHDVEINCNLAQKAISKHVNGGLNGTTKGNYRLIGRELKVRLVNDLFRDHREGRGERSKMERGKDRGEKKQ